MRIKKITLLLFISLFLGSCASTAKLAKTPKENRDPASDEKAYNYFLNGALYDFEDQYEKGLIEYYQALLYDSTSAQIHKAIGRDLMRLQQYESAVKYLKKAYVYDPTDREILNYLGESYYNLKDFQQSLGYYEKLFKVDPYSSSVQNNLIFLYTNLKLNDRLLAFYKKLVEYYPGDTERALQYAMANVKNKNFDEAQRVLENIVGEDSTQLNAMFVLGTLFEVKKDTAQAIKIYHRILSENPDYEDALSNLYRIYRSEKNWNGVDQTYQPLVAMDSSNSQARVILAESYYYQEKYDSAKAVLEPVLKDNDFRPAALELLGRIAFEEALFDQAENYFTLLTQENPRNRYGWILLAVIYNREKKYQNSIDVLQRALTIHSNDPDLLGMYGSTLSEAGREQQALEPLEKAVKLDPNSTNNIASLAALYDKLKMWNKSDSLYEIALKQDPDNALLLNNYSYSLTDRGIDLEKAKQMVEKALSIDPDNGAYLDTIGWIYYNLGQYKEALSFIQKALNAREDSAEVIEHMGDVYYKLGQPDEARKYWEQAIEKDPQNSELKEKIRNL
jgi:tetratricopeptide (TPR) repeat protein